MFSSLSCAYLFRDNSDLVSNYFPSFCLIVMVNFKPGEYMRKMFFQSALTQTAWKKKSEYSLYNRTYDTLVTNSNAPTTKLKKTRGSLCHQTLFM